MTMRKPYQAGVFYPENADELKEEVKNYLILSTEKEDIVGVVCPHSGYIYSGRTAGEVYSYIKSQPTFILIGPNHTRQGEISAISTEGEWSTPIGQVTINTSLAQKILCLSNFLKKDEKAHLYEHSLEVQLPFIQYINSSVKIVPICMQDNTINICQDIGNAIANAIEAEKQKVVIIASSDMTHYASEKMARRKDNLAIEKILNFDPEGLLKIVNEKDISMCGSGPVATMIYATKKLGANQGKLVSYRTSGETNGDYHAVVGYAGIIIK